MRLAVLILIATLSMAKPMINSQREAIEQSDLIVIGDLISGEKTRLDEFLDCHAQIHAMRVLKGPGNLAGQEVGIHWQYLPRRDDPSDLQTNINRMHAIWFLRRKPGSSEYESMWADLFQVPLGGYVLPIPEGTPSGPLAYAADADYQTKLASELATAMASIVAEGSTQLDMVNRAMASRPNASRVGETNWFHTARTEGGTAGAEEQRVLTEFNAMADLFKELDPTRTRAVNTYLIRQQNIHLAVVGLLGELRAKNVDALFVMEKLYPRLNVTYNVFQLAAAVAAIDVSGNETAIEALGRMSVSEIHIFSLTDSAVYQLAAAKSRLGFPYLETMLLDKEPNVSTIAARGICAELASDSGLRTIVDRQLTDACRFTLVAANRIGNHGSVVGAGTEVDAKILNAWLSAHAGEVHRFIPRDPPPAPVWFSAPLGN